MAYVKQSFSKVPSSYKNHKIEKIFQDILSSKVNEISYLNDKE